MNIDFDSEQQWLRELPPEQRLRFLAKLSHLLTISLRVALMSNLREPTSVDSLQEVNEALHRVTGYVSSAVGIPERVSFLDSVMASVRKASGGEFGLHVANAWNAARQEFVGA